MNNDEQYIEEIEPEYTSDIMQDIIQISIGGCGSSLCYWMSTLVLAQTAFWFVLMAGIGIGGIWAFKKTLDLLKIDLTNREVDNADSEKT